MEEGTLITDSDKLQAFESPDDNRASYDCGEGCTDYEFHRFKFKINEDVGDIEELFVLHEGYGLDGHILYIWNDDGDGAPPTPSWELVASTGITGSDQTLSGVFTINIADYIDDDGFLHLLAVSEDPHSSGGTFHTDYVKVEVFTSDYSVESNWTDTLPNIDGSFPEGEWTDPKILIMEPIHTYVYFFNDNDFLYVCVDAANAVLGDYTEDDDDCCSLHFDTSHDESWTYDHEDVFIVYGNGDTYHLVAISPTYTQHCTDWASNHSGLRGIAGFGQSPNATPDHRIYEFRIPLDLLGASPGDTIGFASPRFFWRTSLPHDSNSGLSNIWPPETDVNDLGTWGDIILAEGQPSPLPPSPEPPPIGAVGGEVFPVSKVTLLTPWIALAVVIIFGGAFLIRRRAHN